VPHDQHLSGRPGSAPVLHSCWIDEQAFDAHAALAVTEAFVARMQALIDHEFDVMRTHLLGATPASGL
jgi:quinol monooxygenase YgiN